MRSVDSAPSCPPTVTESARPLPVARLADYVELAKPRIAAMVLMTVSVGYVVGSRGRWDLVPLLHTLLGVGLVAAASSALNQFLERDTDRRMPRTAERPLPAGRLLAAEVLLLGLVAGTAGCVYLAVMVNPLTAALTGATLLLYVAAYTPLKRVTSLCTAIGAVPGALPPVLGWTAAGGAIDGGALSLFGILFLWQFPHFLAIAHLYRGQYADAGLKMLPTASRSARITGV
ncbi:MAG: heme o synthase, partial [Planctomycetaceae bacterium]